MTPTKKAIAAILKYCEGSPSHSALSTVYMLATEALEEYDKEKDEERNLMQKFGTVSIP